MMLLMKDLSALHEDLTRAVERFDALHRPKRGYEVRSSLYRLLSMCGILRCNQWRPLLPAHSQEKGTRLDRGDAGLGG